MIVKPTVFVLGAGAMADYGFPIGWQLVRQVIDNFQPRTKWRELLIEHGHCTDQKIDEFLNALGGSAQNSVDAFLEEREEFLDIGIAAMSIALIHNEVPQKLYEQSDPSINWLRIHGRLIGSRHTHLPFSRNRGQSQQQPGIEHCGPAIK
jgi:hypothetical protein